MITAGMVGSEVCGNGDTVSSSESGLVVAVAVEELLDLMSVDGQANGSLGWV